MEQLQLIFLKPVMISRTWLSKGNWWIKFAKEDVCFSNLWKTIVSHYSEKIAYFDNQKAITYQQLEEDAQSYRQQFLGQRIIRINGLADDWLTQAVAAWTANQMVISYNPDWQVQDLNRYQLVMSDPKQIDWSRKPHLLLFTSGSTGQPKPIVRTTHMALYEAASYIEDVFPEQFNHAICLIKPWFGAMTKHCLGLLLAGIPQYFKPDTTKNTNQKTLIYGTPSLISSHASLATLPWQALSLTGERINAHHIQAFKHCLAPDGFIIDAYGATECGVIARRKLTYDNMDELISSGFSGEILPGKKIHIDAQGLLSIQAFDLPPALTGDIAKQEGNILHLIGRLSSKRKIRGMWVDVSPLINLLSTHPEIFHFELSKTQTSTDQLIVYVYAKNSLNESNLYQWLFQHLTPLNLLPQVVLKHQQPTLGATGKQQVNIVNSAKQIKEVNYISMMADAILNLKVHPNIINKSLEALGFDSLDIISLITTLEKKGANHIPIHAILKTDTPKQIAELLKHDFILRTLTSPEKPKNCQLICIGSGILAARSQLSQLASLKYTDIIYYQKQNFSFSELASSIIEKEHKFLSEAPNLYLAGYSINCLLAIELAYQLEKHQIPLSGLFLLDPPNTKRVRYLKRKKLFLILRARFLKDQPKWQKRYFHEIRKIAILQQPKRVIKTTTMNVYSHSQMDKSPWIQPMLQHQFLQLNFSGHLELVNTHEGIQSWAPLICDFLTESTNC